MPDSRVGRVAMVFAGFGFAVFVCAGCAVDDANRRTLAWVMFGGLSLTLLCGLVMGLAWALGNEADVEGGGSHG